MTPERLAAINVRKCFYCGSTKHELRPYGPQATDICFHCMKASPEREAEAAKNFSTLLAAAEGETGIASIGDEDGPRHF